MDMLMGMGAGMPQGMPPMEQEPPKGEVMEVTPNEKHIIELIRSNTAPAQSVDDMFKEGYKNVEG